MKVLIGIQFALLTVSTVFGQHPIWLDEVIRVDDPGELAYWTAVESDCPLTQEDLGGVVEGVLEENGIEPVTQGIFDDDRVYMNLTLRCASMGQSNEYAFGISIHFGRYKPWPAILYDAPFEDFGLGTKSLIEQRCEDVIEIAVAAFEKANTITLGKQ